MLCPVRSYLSEDNNVQFLLCHRFGFSFVGRNIWRCFIALYWKVLLLLRPAPVDYDGCVFGVDDTDPLPIFN